MKVMNLYSMEPSPDACDSVRKSSKLQSPNSKEAPIPKVQTTMRRQSSPSFFPWCRSVWSARHSAALLRGALAFSIVLASLSITWAAATSDSSVVDTWLASQAKIKTWAADFVQTRTFKTLSQPLKESGHVWFEAPDKFHWELGHPPKTIAVRAPNEMLLFYPRLKRVERYPLTEAAGPWREAMGLLEAGFPRSKQQMESRFKILSQKVTDHTCQLTLEPKSPGARKMMPHIGISFDTQSHNLLSTSIEFADGSSMRNDFSNPELNPQVDPKMFSPEIPADYKVIEPLKNAK